MPAVGFREAAHYTDRLAGAGFVPALSLIERFEVTYEDPWRLLESLKGIGAGLSGQPGFSPLAAASLKKLMEYYAANFKMDKGVRATYRVLYYLSEPTT